MLRDVSCFIGRIYLTRKGEKAPMKKENQNNIGYLYFSGVFVFA